MTEAHVVIVDDDADIRRLLRAYVENMGHRVSEAANGEDYLATYSDQSVDLVLLDILMPKMHGAELLNILARNQGDEAIIIISSQDDTTIGTSISLAKSRGLNVAGYVKKPFDQNDVEDAINNALGG